MLVDIVRDAHHVVLLAEVCHHFNLLPSVNLSEGVVWVVEDNGLCLFVEETLELLLVELPVGGGHHTLGLRGSQGDEPERE